MSATTGVGARGHQRSFWFRLRAALVAVPPCWVTRRRTLVSQRLLRQFESSLGLVDVKGLSQAVEITGDHEFHAATDALIEMSGRLQTTVAELERQAFHDSLTGLPNRALLERYLLSALADPKLGPVGVVVLDLDGFKAINDGLGHPAGDELLIAVGERLQRSLRPNDMIGRLGGDELAASLDADNRVLLAVTPSKPMSEWSVLGVDA